MMRIIETRFGSVDEGVVREIRVMVNECYARLQPHAVLLVDLYLFQRASLMNAFINEEKRRIGIGTSPFDESFLAIHDAWRGTPRVMIAVDRLWDLPMPVRVGAIHHETAHTVLHGSLDHYIFAVPSSVAKRRRMTELSRQTLMDLVYLVSIAVKDYEVTRLLYAKEYVEDQVAYAKHLLEPSEDDVLAWELARMNRTSQMLALVSLLKPACCAAPLTADERYGDEVADAIARSMNYLPEDTSTRVFDTLKIVSEFGNDTHMNVELFANQIALELL